MECKNCKKLKKLRVEIQRLKVQIKFIEECKCKWEDAAKKKQREIDRPVVTITAPGNVVIETIQIHE